MKYCTRCLYPENHPLTITFDAEGVCSGCRVHEEKDELDWNQRGEKLKKILERYRTDSYYDCIVPVSGAGDSFFVVDLLKNKYGMNPLLVTYNRHFNTLSGLRNISNLRTRIGADILTLTLEPRLIQKLTQYCLEKLASIYWPVLAGQSVYPVQTAVRYRIPLIVWGAHQGCDQVGMFSHTDEVEMTRKYRKEHDLMGYEAEDLVDTSRGMPWQDLQAFAYPSDKAIQQVGVRGIYLGNYVRWDSKAQHEAMIPKYQYETCEQQRTFDTYNHVDCAHYTGAHDYIKYLKFGYGKASDHACREIRLGRLSREEAIQKREAFQKKAPKDLEALLKWLELSSKDFHRMVDLKRDLRAWHKVHDHWELVDPLGPERVQGASVLNLKEPCEFLITRPGIKPAEPYALLSRGYFPEHGDFTWKPSQDSKAEPTPLQP